MMKINTKKGRKVRARRGNKMTKNLERLYKESKCREISVLVTRMDFAKILGKFTKVKIQYESSNSQKAKEPVATHLNSRLKKNENGMVLIHRSAYNQHPAKEPKKPKQNEITTPRTTIKNVEEDWLKKTPSVISKDKNSNYSKKPRQNSKNYGIIFESPPGKLCIDVKSKTSLLDLLPVINKSILPSEDWCIEYFPKNEEPKDDKVYDRIAAELEDLMYNEKPQPKPAENKVDDFPSIMDILNDNSAAVTDTKTEPNSSIDFKETLESSDVEAILLGKVSTPVKEMASIPMEEDSSNVSVNTDEKQVKDVKMTETVIENPLSPSILDEALQKGIEEHLPSVQSQTGPNIMVSHESTITHIKYDIIAKEENKKNDDILVPSTASHVVFKTIDSALTKSVICSKNLKYNIELAGKPVELLGAPKFINNLIDLKILLQIVHETDLEQSYVEILCPV